MYCDDKPIEFGDGDEDVEVKWEGATSCIQDMGDLTGHTLLITLPSGADEDAFRSAKRLIPAGCSAIIVPSDVSVEKLEELKVQLAGERN